MQKEKARANNGPIGAYVHAKDIQKVFSEAEVTGVAAVAGAFDAFQGYAKLVPPVKRAEPVGGNDATEKEEAVPQMEAEPVLAEPTLTAQAVRKGNGTMEEGEVAPEKNMEPAPAEPSGNKSNGRVSQQTKPIRQQSGSCMPPPPLPGKALGGGGYVSRYRTSRQRTALHSQSEIAAKAPLGKGAGAMGARAEGDTNKPQKRGRGDAAARTDETAPKDSLNPLTMSSRMAKRRRGFNRNALANNTNRSGVDVAHRSGKSATGETARFPCMLEGEMKRRSGGVSGDGLGAMDVLAAHRVRYFR